MILKIKISENKTYDTITILFSADDPYYTLDIHYSSSVLQFL